MFDPKQHAKVGIIGYSCEYCGMRAYDGQTQIWTLKLFVRDQECTSLTSAVLEPLARPNRLCLKLSAKIWETSYSPFKGPCKYSEQPFE
jgi:hypothetical protein